MPIAIFDILTPTIQIVANTGQAFKGPLYPPIANKAMMKHPFECIGKNRHNPKAMTKTKPTPSKTTFIKVSFKKYDHKSKAFKRASTIVKLSK